MMEGILHTGAEGSMEIAGCLRMKWNKKNSPAIVFPSLYWLPLGLSSEEYFVSLMQDWEKRDGGGFSMGLDICY